MATKVGGKVHPWYKGYHEWEVKGIADLKKPIEYYDPKQGNVSYDPKILQLESKTIGKVLWFAYWIATEKTKGKMKWGQSPPIIEEDVFVDLFKDAVKQKFFTKSVLQKLQREINTTLDK